MPSPSAELARRRRRRFWREVIIQGSVVAACLGILALMVHFALQNLKAQGISSGLDFLHKQAGFSIIQHLIPYSERSTFGDALVVAFLNTLLVSLLGMILATGVGAGLGLLRLAHHQVLRRIAAVYVEVVRNIPLLLQLFFWYFGVLRTLPMPEDSYRLPGGIFLNIRGLYLPSPWTGERPSLGRFNIEGGIEIQPEFVALTLTLTLYTAAFIAELVRAGITAVPKGQWEAGLSLGLTKSQTLRLIVMPQAMRVILPPLVSQWLNLTKNSSLGAAIAYPEIALVFAGTVLLQTGQAVEVMGITMGLYLVLSLVMATAAHLYDRRLQRPYANHPQNQATP